MGQKYATLIDDSYNVFVARTKTIQNGTASRDWKSLEQIANVRRAPISVDMIPFVLLMGLTIQAISVPIIPALDHLIVLPCQIPNSIVFVIQAIKRMKMVNVNKSRKLMNAKWKMNAQQMLIVLILFTVRDPMTISSI